MPHGVNRIYSAILQIYSLIGNMSIRVDFKKHTIEFVLIFFGFGLLFGYLYIKLKCTPWRKARTISLSYLCFWAVVQSLSHVWLFATSWTAARQASLSFTVSLSLLKLMSIHVQWCYQTISTSFASSSCPQSVPASGNFSMSWFFAPAGQSTMPNKAGKLLPIPGNFSYHLGSILFYFSSTIILLFMMKITTFFL